MKRSTVASVAMVVTASAVGVTAFTPAAASAQTAAEGDGAPGIGVPDLTTADGVRASLKQHGVTDAQVDAFAAKFGLDRQSFYEKLASISAQASSTTDKARFGVELDNGILRYTNQVSRTMRFKSSSTRTQTGRKVDRGCSFPTLQGRTSTTEHTVSEVVELDPEACTRVVFDGVYDPAAQPRPSRARFPFNCNNGSGPETGTPTSYNPGIGWVRGEYRGYVKHSFVDPVCITITSSTLNVRWKNSGSVSVTRLSGSQYRNFYFDDLGENWINKQVWTSAGSAAVTRTAYVTNYLDHLRTETNFPEYLLAVAAAIGLGAVGVVIAACGGDLGDTHFDSDQHLYAYRNGIIQWYDDAYVWGGCSSLIHQRLWAGGGYAR